jgi:2-octaprenyl-6-methoxyphenol hydroxylase
MSKVNAVQAAVVGAGPAGCLAAIALADAGIDTLLAGPRPAADNRTTALMAGSVDALERLGVWASCREHAAPLRTLRIADATSRLLRAPEARFEAPEIGIEAFACNIENVHLLAALERKAASMPRIHRIEETVTAVRIHPDDVEIALADGQSVHAALVVGADGAKSLCREAAGIESAGWSYPQHALTFNIAHSRPHHDISTEFHTETGPFTLVPLRGLRSSVVCVVDPAESEYLRALDDAALAQEIERRSHSILGKVTLEPGRGHFPLAVQTAKSFGARRIALVGEAAHRIPPIGAQGLNLGLRDAVCIAELAGEVHAGGIDIGGDEVLARYDARRRTDIVGRTVTIDLLNRSLLSGFLPVQGLRGLGIALLNRIGPLRRAVMREGVMPANRRAPG